MKARSRFPAFEAKADRMLRWAQSTVDELNRYGELRKMDDVERCFFALLTQIAAAHEALASGARLLGQTAWRDNLNLVRATDPVLLYLWKARDSDTHDALVKWRETFAGLGFRIADPKTAMAIVRRFKPTATRDEAPHLLIQYLFGSDPNEGGGATPGRSGVNIIERGKEAGISVDQIMRDLALMPFNYRENGRSITIEPPAQHFGKSVPSTAGGCSNAAIAFYSEKLTELRVLAAGPESL